MPLITASPWGVQTRCATMRPSVIVPVLSVAITDTEPRASTAGSWRTMAWWAAIRRAPRARLKVMTVGQGLRYGGNCQADRRHGHEFEWLAADEPDYRRRRHTRSPRWPPVRGSGRVVAAGVE